MSVWRRIRNTFFLPVIIGLLCACGFQDKVIQLNEEQKASIKIICENVEKWSLEYQDSGQSWPVNHVYLSEIDDGTTLMTVGYLASGGGSGIDFFWGVRTYAITDKIYNYKTDLSLEWGAYGIDIDIKHMSDDEIQEVIEQSYLEFCKTKN